VTPARRDFCYAGDLANVVVQAAEGKGLGTYHFSSGKDVAILELYDSVVRAMKLNDYPEPELKPLGPDDAPSILLTYVRGFLRRDIHAPRRDRQTCGSTLGERRSGCGYTHLKEARADIKTSAKA
jgi:UDP-glucose 4-epimerase